jgi:hypothetical protein
VVRTLAKLRVPLGFLAGLMVLYLAQPTSRSLLVGGAIASAGECLRIWAAGHLTRWREVTRSGPYRFIRHPLYVGSTVMGVGLAVACANVGVAVVIAIYLAATLSAAIRFEQRELTEQFGRVYTEYREGHAAAVDRGFSVRRAIANREYRAAAGLVIGLALLWMKRS